jgi:hypothetical protein
MAEKIRAKRKEIESKMITISPETKCDACGSNHSRDFSIFFHCGHFFH